MVKSPSWLAKLGTLSLLYVSVFLTRIGFGSILVIFPYYLNIPLSNSSLAGIIIALYPAVEGFSALPVGTFVDLGGRRKAFVAGMTMISILTLIIGLSNNLVLVGGAHALEGLAAAMVTVASLTMITDLTVKENRGASMGGFDLANLAGYGTGILLGLSFLHVFATNLGYSFLVVSAVMGASAIFVYFALHEPVHSSMEHGSLRGIYETFTGDVIGILPVWFSLTVVLGFFLFLPRLVKNAGVTDLAQSAPLILLALLVLGVGSDKAAKEFRGSAMGLYSLMLSGGIATGTVLAGISDDLGGVQAVFYSAAIIFGGLGLTSAWLLRKQQSLAKRAVDLNSSGSKPI